MSRLDALGKVLPVLLVIALGAGLRRAGLLGERAAGELKRLAVNVTLPALLFLAFARLQVDPRTVRLAAVMFLLCLAGLGVGSLLRPAVAPGARTFPVLFTGFEAGMMGYALYASLYGQENLHRFAAVDLGHVLFVFAVLIPVLRRATRGRTSPGEAILGVARSPVVLAIALGLLAGWSGLLRALQGRALLSGLPDAAALVGGMTTPLVALLVGCDLRLRARGLGRPALAIGLRLLFWIPVGLLVGELMVRRWLGLDRGVAAAVLLMVVLPPPFVIPIFLPEEERAELDLTVSSLALATLATLVAVTGVAIAYPP
ncbi:MAG TPA: AEC family transporter [Anaeromyxobacter sp.]|nr:AEC family transporter [Anaeromyxobacter sp.]